jgi:hypothetical protein
MFYSEVAFLFTFTVCLFNLGFRHLSVSSQGKINRHTTGLISNIQKYTFFTYSHLFNERGGGAKVAKSLNVEGGIFWEKLIQCVS